jgi:hypothetical protein
VCLAVGHEVRSVTTKGAVVAMNPSSRERDTLMEVLSRGRRMKSILEGPTNAEGESLVCLGVHGAVARSVESL